MGMSNPTRRMVGVVTKSYPSALVWVETLQSGSREKRVANFRSISNVVSPVCMKPSTFFPAFAHIFSGTWK